LEQTREETMHDIDRVRLESQSETELFESGALETGQFEFAQAEAGEVFGETEQMELASELLEIMSEAELDRFLGKLIRRAGHAVGRFVRSPEGRAIGGALKGAAKQVLPTIGSNIGQYFGGERGARTGEQLAALASQAFGLELEGLSAEDREFEVARRYVNFAGEAVKNLALTPSSSDPRAAAKTAVASAARTHAPGLLRPDSLMGREPGAPSPLPRSHSGRWLRRGGKIVLYGI
jgi:hypothetical protein